MELRDIDKPGYLVHGSYLENLTRIFKAGGLFPRDSLPKKLKPLRFFKKRILKNDRAARSGAKGRCISTVVLHDNKYGYRAGLCDQYLWGNPTLFHFHIVSNYRFRELSTDTRELYGKYGLDLNLLDYPHPYHTEGSEVILFNQSIELDTFVGFVVPTDEMIQSLPIKEKKEIFKSQSGKRHHLMSEFDIARKIRDKLKRYSTKDIPIFFFDGEMYKGD